MDDTAPSDRWMALAGPLFLVLVALAFLLPGGSPGEHDSAKEVVKHFRSADTRTVAGVFLSGPAAAVLLVIASRLRAAFGSRATAAGTLMQSGAVLYAAALTIGASISLAAVTASHDRFEAAAQTLSVLSAAAWIPLVIGMAALLFGAGLAVLRTGLLPRWLGWVGVVVGAVSILGPGGFLGFLVGPIWVGVAGVLLYLRPVLERPAAERPVDAV